MPSLSLGATLITGKTVSATLRDQMTGRRIRLAAGFVLFTYIAGHLTMHALGNVSWQAMEAATHVHNFVWHSKVGTTLLYGSFAFHFGLALWALYDRRSFRMGSGEWMRLLLGFSILPLLLHHWAAGRYVYSAYDISRTYDVVLTVYFGFVPWWGWRQIAVLLIVWTHGCLGIHFWLRSRPFYHRCQAVLLAAAVLLPTLALLGIWQGAREALAYGRANPEWLQALIRNGHLRDPAIGGPSWNLEVQLYWIYGLLVAFVIAARGVRRLIQRRQGLIGISYPSGQRVDIPKGYTVLDASRRARIPHAAICGGRGRCSTCRVRVLRGQQGLPAPSPSEVAVLARLGAGPNVRLACQLRPRAEVSVLLLLPPDVTAYDRRTLSADSRGSEQFVTVMFVDIRQSTALVENRLPFDVVFILNHFFEAVAGAVVEEGGTPNQFLGDGMLAVFRTNTQPQDACRHALRAARRIVERLDDLNAKLANELARPITIGIGLHAGPVIFGEIGYRDNFVVTAIGDTVHVAARLQDLTKEYSCELLVSDVVATTAKLDLSAFPMHTVQVRGREAQLNVWMIKTARDLHPASVVA
jgi:adenylate cyclase